MLYYTVATKNIIMKKTLEKTPYLIKKECVAQHISLFVNYFLTKIKDTKLYHFNMLTIFKE